jgi:hypothetical protein
MSRSPAAELARLKVTYGHAYQIYKEEPSGKLIATDRASPVQLLAATTAELEALLLRDRFDQRSGPLPS